MAIKKLKSGKNINSKNVADLSFTAKEQLYEAVRKQFIETMKLPAEYSDISDGVNSMGYLVLRTGYHFNEYCEAVSGKYQLRSQKTELCSFLSDLCEKSRSFLMRKEIRIIFRVPERKIFVKTDVMRLCHSVLDIILNSAENTPPKGTVKIQLSATKKFAKLTVCDNGFGMDEETIKHCFEPFFTSALTKGWRKMGLGLTLARHFVTESGGRINVSSKKGKGTAVSILLPLINGDEDGFSVEVSAPEVTGEKFSPVYIMLSGIKKEE